MAADWRSIVPQLAALHRSGNLVPFTGLGMSRPRCTSWKTFVQRLCERVGVPHEANFDTEVDEPTLLRLADDAMRSLRGSSSETRRAAFESALYERDTFELPPQASALASLRWPLVITTNYDDVIWHAAEQEPWNTEPFEVLGRSLRDCQSVLRSLDWPSRPVLWAIQGYLGGPFQSIRNSVPNSAQRMLLLNQLVVGHRQYQEAAHLNPHFRRAFAEVFRRRALLFLGSGITEGYLANLFGEVILTQGQRAGAHYALLPEHEVEEGKLRFLSDRLGVLAFTYSQYDEVTEFLKRLQSNVMRFMPLSFRQGQLDQDAAVDVANITYRIQQPSGSRVDLVLDHGQLVELDRHEEALKDKCLAVSVGRYTTEEGTQLAHGSMSRDVSRALCLDVTEFDSNPRRGYIFPHLRNRSFVAVAARATNTTTGAPEARTLDAIQKATDALVRYALEELGLNTVRLGLLSSGPTAPWHPIFACVSMLSAIRESAQKLDRSFRVELVVVDSRVWTRVLSGALPVQEILSAARLPVFVQVAAQDGEVGDAFVHMAAADTSLGDLLRKLNFPEDQWTWDITPVQAASLPETRSSADNLLLVPFSTITLSQHTPARAARDRP